MSFNLRNFTQWFNQESDMAPKTDYSTMRKINDIIDSIQIPNLRIERDYARDEIIFINTNDHKSIKLSRFELEDSKIPVSMICEVINKIMPWDHTGAIGSSAPLPYIPYTPSTYEYNPCEEVNSMNEIASQNKIFTPSDIIRINDVKARVKQHMETYFSLIRNRFVTQKYVVAGGCFASLFHNEDPRDYDFFLLKSAANSEIIEQLKIDLEKNSTTDYGTSYRIGDVTYLKNDKITDTIMLDRSRVQLINTQYNTREELVKHFDFKHCCVSYDFFTDKLYISRDVYDAIMDKKLIPNDPKKPAAHWRYEKFFAKGWKGEIYFQEVA